jgi:hypothetical protein
MIASAMHDSSCEIVNIEHRFLSLFSSTGIEQPRGLNLVIGKCTHRK